MVSSKRFLSSREKAQKIQDRTFAIQVIFAANYF